EGGRSGRQAAGGLRARRGGDPGRGVMGWAARTASGIYDTGGDRSAGEAAADPQRKDRPQAVAEAGAMGQRRAGVDGATEYGRRNPEWNFCGGAEARAGWGAAEFL